MSNTQTAPEAGQQTAEGAAKPEAPEQGATPTSAAQVDAAAPYREKAEAVYNEMEGIEQLLEQSSVSEQDFSPAPPEGVAEDGTKIESPTQPQVETRQEAIKEGPGELRYEKAPDDLSLEQPVSKPPVEQQEARVEQQPQEQSTETPPQSEQEGKPPQFRIRPTSSCRT